MKHIKKNRALLLLGLLALGLLSALPLQSKATSPRIVFKPGYKTLYYNGKQQTPYNPADYPDIIFEGLTFSSIPYATAVGDYAVTVYLKDKVNTQWDTFDTDPKFASWSIEKGRLSPSLERSFFQADGSVHTPSVLPAGDYFNVSGETSASAPGNYQLHVSIREPNNYRWANHPEGEVVTLNWGIAQPLPGPVVSTGLQYNGQVQTGVSGAGHFTLSGVTEAKAAGTYTATARLNEPDKYFWASTNSNGDLDLTWTIGQVKVAPPDVKTFLVYNGQPQNGVSEGPDYSLDIYGTEAGAYLTTVTLNDPANMKWSDSNNSDHKSFYWYINPAPVDLPEPILGLVYTGQPQQGVKDNPGFTLSNHIKTEVGEHLATATLVDPKNTQWGQGQYSGPLPIAWSIDKGEIDPPEAIDNLTYNGQVQVGV